MEHPHVAYTKCIKGVLQHKIMGNTVRRTAKQLKKYNNMMCYGAWQYYQDVPFGLGYNAGESILKKIISNKIILLKS